jgi:hypothetical protein
VIRHGPWFIYFEPPPIPSRACPVSGGHHSRGHPGGLGAELLGNIGDVFKERGDGSAVRSR